MSLRRYMVIPVPERRRGSGRGLLKGKDISMQDLWSSRKQEHAREKRLKKIPKFRSINAIAQFWDTHSAADYWDQMEETGFVVSPALRRRIRHRKLLSRRLEKLLNEWRSLAPYWKYNDSLLCFPKGQKWFFRRVPFRPSLIKSRQCEKTGTAQKLLRLAKNFTCKSKRRVRVSENTDRYVY